MPHLMRSLAILGAMALVLTVAAPASASVDLNIGFSVNFGPPALPVYEQPPCPAPNYLWTPGYWGYGPYGYFWVPGTWVLAPGPGLLWTPGYYGYNGGGYRWHPGYWGPHIGFYGGINYGFGYFGAGFVGGGWRGNQFAYNTAVTNVNTTVVRNVYINKTVVNNNYYNNVTKNISYNGGPNGVQATPTAEQRSFQNEPRAPMTSLQEEHVQTAGTDRNQLAAVNNGRPAYAAVERPFTRDNPPASFKPVQAQDRAAAQERAGAATPANGALRTNGAPNAPTHEAQPGSAWDRFNQPGATRSNQATQSQYVGTPGTPATQSRAVQSNATQSSAWNRFGQTQHSPQAVNQQYSSRPANQPYSSRPANQPYSTRPANQSRPPSYAHTQNYSTQRSGYGKATSGHTPQPNYQQQQHQSARQNSTESAPAQHSYAPSARGRQRQG